MNPILKNLAAPMAFVLLAASASATQVQFIGVSPAVTINIDIPGGPLGYNTPAGVFNIKVDGVPTKAFCIDLWDGLPGTATYSEVALAAAPDGDATAPLALTPMGATKASNIKSMWAQWFADATSGPANKAAGFQAAIWETVGGPGTINTTPAVLAQMAIYLNSGSWVSGQTTLGALTSNVYQDFVYDPPDTGVPDGGLTLGMLGVGVLALGMVRRRA